MDDKAFGGFMTSFRGGRTWVWTAEYKALREALDRISAALVQAGYSHQPDNAAPGHRNSAEVAECVEMAVARLDLLEAKEANRIAMRDPDKVCVEVPDVD